MSSLVFPAALPKGYSIFKAPGWATRKQRSVSGRTLTCFDYTNPIWSFRLTFEILRDRQVGSFTSEIRKLMDFVNQLRGGHDTFLFVDSTDYTVTDEPIGTGDGAETEFQLKRALYTGGFAENIIAPNVVTNVKVSGTPATHTVDAATGIVTMAAPPTAAAAVTSTFTYYFRCRFTMDSTEFENFASLQWGLAELRFESVLL